MERPNESRSYDAMRVQTPQRALQFDIESTTHLPVSEARVVEAIRALDGYTKSGSPENSPSAKHFRALMRGFAYFLELAMAMKETEDVAMKSILLTVLEARILSCIARFRRRLCSDSAFWRCPEQHEAETQMKSCGHRLIRTALACFLFLMSRERPTSLLVVRSGLHQLVMELCASSRHAIVSDTSTSPPPVDCETRDVLLGVDPFDWSIASVAKLLRQDTSQASVFLLPIGPRTLSTLLAGNRLPQNEAEEYALQCRSGGRLASRSLRTKPPRHLPSMFTFKTTVEAVDIREVSRCFLCSPSSDAEVWDAATQETTSIHLALRALVALALHLPRASVERKQFLRDGARCCLVGLVHRYACHQLESGQDESISREDTDTNDLSAKTSEVAGVLHVMALAGLREVEADLDTSSPSKALSNPSSPMQPANQTQRPSSPAANTSVATLQDQIRAVEDKCRKSSSRKQELQLQHERLLERSQIRQRIRELCTQAEVVRTHLLHSLDVLVTGRKHPNPDQSVVDWLDSFSTIEKKEQGRREQEEMKQRRLMEMQYQIDERRRREREERNRMARNDVNIPDTDEYSHQEQKRMAFQVMQQQLRELQVIEDEVVANSKAKVHGQHDLDGREAERERKRLEALEQVKRVQQQTAERKKEATENELMKREDHYYAEKILREKQREAEQLKQLKKIDPIEEQWKRIERMKQADAERKHVELALEKMRNEDLLARQMRFRDAEIRKMDVQREWKARKDMQDEETDSRLRWRLIEQARVKQEEDERKRQRAEERRQRREQEKQQRAELAAWIECYDSNGYIYYYNQLTGASQWEDPYTSTPT